VESLGELIKAGLAAQADPSRAAGQQAYMKSAMPFYGVRAGDVRKLTLTLGRAAKLSWEQIAAVSRQLWDQAERREERYAAIELTALAKGRLELVDLYEYQVRDGAWWDFTDSIAHRIADLHRSHPQETAELTRRWAGEDSLWVRRLAIIGQLGLKQATDKQLLAEVIAANLADQEFFIRKAIGWALRDLARTDPEWVRAQAASWPLSPLSRREALKHL
jgi:3-methyladenine DNA glycosylase AlkD